MYFESDIDNKSTVFPSLSVKPLQPTMAKTRKTHV